MEADFDVKFGVLVHGFVGDWDGTSALCSISYSVKAEYSRLATLLDAVMVPL